MPLGTAKDNNNGRVSHKMVFNIVQSLDASQPWITRDVVNAFFKKA